MVFGSYGGGHLNFLAGRSPSACPSVFPLAWITAGQGHRFPKSAGSKCQKHVVFSWLDCDFSVFLPVGNPWLGPVSATSLDHGEPRAESFKFGPLKSIKTRGFKLIWLAEIEGIIFGLLKSITNTWLYADLAEQII